MRRFLPAVELFAVLLLALAVRLPYLPIPGHAADLWLFSIWGNTAQQHSVWQAYAREGATLNYPPLYLLVLDGLARVSVNQGEPFRMESPNTLLRLKIAPLVGDLLLVGMAYILLYNEGRGPVVRRLVPLALAVHPGLIAASSFWGQVDAPFTVLMLGALLLLRAGQPRRAWAVYALALLFKFQAVVLLPLLVVLTFRRFGPLALRDGVVVLGVLMAVVMTPFVVGSGRLAFSPYIGAVGFQPFTTVNALNLWYLHAPPVESVRNVPDQTLHDLGTWIVQPLNYRYAGLLMLGSYTALICGLIWMRPQARGEFVWAAALYFGFFMLPTQIHERYLFPGVVFMLLAIADDWRIAGVALGVAYTFTYNIYWTATKPFEWLFLTDDTFDDRWAVGVALVNLLLLGAYTAALIAFGQRAAARQRHMGLRRLRRTKKV